MPEFLRLLPPDEARELLLSHLNFPGIETEVIDTAASLDRITAADIIAPHALPEFPRSTVDGYAVLARDTFGASDALPAYLKLIGEVRMGAPSPLEVTTGECVLMHTGGMLPEGANAIVMLEHTQSVRGSASVQGAKPRARKELDDRSRALQANAPGEIEISKAVAEGENVIRVGEDVLEGQAVIRRGVRLKPAQIGGLMALGIVSLRVAKKVRIGLISSGDEVVPAEQNPARGQVRDVNAHSLAALVAKSGGEPVFYGIVPDDPVALRRMTAQALADCAAVVVTAGSSAGARDATADVINSLGVPGVLVHGINTRPGKPTILGVCAGKAAIGLPGNPVSALINGYMFVVPVVEALLGLPLERARPSITARLTINLPSQAGREDWWPVILTRRPVADSIPDRDQDHAHVNWSADPIFGRSNLIFTLAAADGLLRIPLEVTGLSAGAIVEVFLF
jgi:molybdopterin molybdotransferase